MPEHSAALASIRWMPGIAGIHFAREPRQITLFTAAIQTQPVKRFLKRCPDGEVGGRRLWISYQWPILRATPFLTIESDTAIPGMGLTRLRLKPDVKADDIHFGELGYAREARTWRPKWRWPSPFSIRWVDANPGIAQIDLATQLDVDKATRRAPPWVARSVLRGR